MMRQKHNFVAGGIAAAALVALMGLAGCSTTAGVETTGKTSWDEQGARILEKNVVFNSSSLKGDLQIVDLRGVQAGDIMRAQATLRSRDKDTLQFQYRFDWYDAGGLEINSGAGSWKPLLLTGRETKTVQGVAPDPRAKEFKLKIREME
ncbi:MAG: YcfL family protein [Desulfuromonadaceae bacterium]|nr:YcfL family protein [Desulfuromonadaceae bacterium]MDD2847741.1 YcfL family protein [Desulfuromonadaceae bacterium]MDD4131013.1 YcfL family protein [Desulfuromonadaceae bacterium]